MQTQFTSKQYGILGSLGHGLLKVYLFQSFFSFCLKSMASSRNRFYKNPVIRHRVKEWYQLGPVVPARPVAFFCAVPLENATMHF